MSSERYELFAEIAGRVFGDFLPRRIEDNGSLSPQDIATLTAHVLRATRDDGFLRDWHLLGEYQRAVAEAWRFAVNDHDPQVRAERFAFFLWGTRLVESGSPDQRSR